MNSITHDFSFIERKEDLRGGGELTALHTTSLSLKERKTSGVETDEQHYTRLLFH